MQWDLGVQGLALMAGLALGFGILAGLLAGGGTARRVRTAAIGAAACFVAGLVTSEVFFGWATEVELQPNVDGLSTDEVLLACAVTTVVVVVLARAFTRRSERPGGP